MTLTTTYRYCHLFSGHKKVLNTTGVTSSWVTTNKKRGPKSTFLFQGIINPLDMI